MSLMLLVCLLCAPPERAPVPIDGWGAEQVVLLMCDLNGIELDAAPVRTPVRLVFLIEYLDDSDPNMWVVVDTHFWDDDHELDEHVPATTMVFTPTQAKQYHYHAQAHIRETPR